MRKGTKTILLISSAALVGAGGYFAAPYLASYLGAKGLLGITATTGNSISSLKGAALTNASLAKFGGGAISVGGKGIMGGKITFSATSSTTYIAGMSSVGSNRKFNNCNESIKNEEGIFKEEKTYNEEFKKINHSISFSAVVNEFESILQDKFTNNN